jgi:hypothetical protein
MTSAGPAAGKASAMDLSTEETKTGGPAAMVFASNCSWRGSNICCRFLCAPAGTHERSSAGALQDTDVDPDQVEEAVFRPVVADPAIAAVEAERLRVNEATRLEKKASEEKQREFFKRHLVRTIAVLFAAGPLQADSSFSPDQDAWWPFMV